MEHTLNTQRAEQTIKRFKQWVKSFETAKELFPELDTKQWITLADCLDEVINSKR
jgi:phosphohistidine phosphatase SixA